jgi:enoyl-CoA hydratase
MTYETILTEQRGRVKLITLNRPKAMNALNTQLSHEVIDVLTKSDRDDGVGCGRRGRADGRYQRL